MNLVESRRRMAALMWASCLLAGCGGGGGEGGGSTPPTLSGTASLEATLDVLVASSITAQWNGPAGTSPQCVLTSGSLPAGMTLSSACVLSGSPSTTGSFAPRVTLTANGYTGSIAIDGRLTVVGPSLGSPASPSGTGLQVGTAVSNLPVVGVSYTAPFGARAGDVLSYQITSGALPAGLSLDAATGLVTGTPTQEQSQTFAVGATLTRGGGSYTLPPYTVTLPVQAAPVDTRAEGVYIRDPADAFGGWVLVRPDGTLWWLAGQKVASSQGAGAGTRFVPTDLATGKASPASGSIPEFSLTSFGGAPLTPAPIVASGHYDPVNSSTLDLTLGRFVKPEATSYRYDTSPAALGTVTLQSLMTGGAPVTVTLTFQEDGSITGTRLIDGDSSCNVTGAYVVQSNRNFHDVRLSQTCFDNSPGVYVGVAWVHRYSYEGATVSQVLLPLAKANGTSALLLVSP